MKTDEVEKVMKRKLQPGKSLQTETTPAEWAEICFKTAVETEVISEQHIRDRQGTDAEIEARVRAKWKKVLEDCGGDYEKAVNLLP